MSMPERKTRQWLVLHLAVLVYSGTTICAKLASAQEVLSAPFLCWLGLEVLCLGIYALVWQQAIRRIPLSVAYANKAVGLLWALLWGVLLFGEAVTPGRIAGIALVIAGTFLMNGDTTGGET